MKKMLIGCGVVALILFCLLVGFLVWGFFQVKGYFNSYEEMRTAYVETNTKYAFPTPDSYLLDADRFHTYVEVRNQVASTLKDELTMFQELSAMMSDPQASGDVGIGDLLRLVDLPRRVGEAHIAALEMQEMSVDEFLWNSRVVGGTVLRAIEKGEDVATEVKDSYQDFEKRMTSQSAQYGPRNSANQPSIRQLDDLLDTRDVPLNLENLRLINEAKDDLSQYPEMMFLDLILRTMGLGGDRPTQTESNTPSENPFAPPELAPEPTPQPVY